MMKTKERFREIVKAKEREDRAFQEARKQREELRKPVRP